uniref:Putative secreted protein n=1 Tax=Amblyomma triste TaxID=251400 RepID=A0A023G2X7_AMBTT
MHIGQFLVQLLCVCVLLAFDDMHALPLSREQYCSPFQEISICAEVSASICWPRGPVLIVQSLFYHELELTNR